MLKNSSKRKSIYKEFPAQQIGNINANSASKNQHSQMSVPSTNQSSSLSGSAQLSQPITSKNNYLSLQNQKIQIIARLIPEEPPSSKYEPKEGIRSEKCIFKLNKNELQIIAPDEKKILEEIDGFQKREKIQHSPPELGRRFDTNGNRDRLTSPFSGEFISQNSQMMRNEGDMQRQYQGNMKENVNAFTPEKEKRTYIRPFESPISKISYNESTKGGGGNEKRPNTFTFDNIFDESTNDESLFQSIKPLYLNNIRNGKNLILLNFNRCLANSSTLLKEIISGLQELKQVQGFSYLASEKAQFFFHSYEIMQPNNERIQLFELSSLSFQQPNEIIKSLNQKFSQIPRKSQQSCTVYNFQLFDDNKLINEIVIIDMYTFLDKRYSQQTQSDQSNTSQLYFNSYCKDLMSLLNLQQTGSVNTSDLFQQIFLQKYRLNDELMVLANFRVIQPHITNNYYLLLLTQILYKQKVYQRSMFLQFCQIQNQYMHQLHGRDLSIDVASLSLKEENQVLSQKNSMFKEQIRILTADLIYHQERVIKINEENKMYLADISSLKKIIHEQDNLLAENKRKISDQTAKINGLRKSFGMLENFDKSMMIAPPESKNKSFHHSDAILNNIYSSKKQKQEVETISQFTQTETVTIQQNSKGKQIQNENENYPIIQRNNDQQLLQQIHQNNNTFGVQSQQQQAICRNCKQIMDKQANNDKDLSQYHFQRSFNILQDQINSEPESQIQSNGLEDDKNNIITPNRYLQHLDDLLSNLDSKRSTYFSPRNLSLANLALIENEGFKQKLIIKEQEIEKLQNQLVQLNQQFIVKEKQFKFKVQEKLENLQTSEKLITMFEKKIISNDNVIQEIVEFYENEFLDLKEIISFAFKTFIQQSQAMKQHIIDAHLQKEGWISVFTKKTEELNRQMIQKLQQKNEKISQYEQVLEKFGKLHPTK